MKHLFLALILFLSFNAQAALKIDITQGKVEPMPIAINPFYNENGNEDDFSQKLRLVIINDLENSGLFRSINSDSFLEKLTADKEPSHVSWRQIGALAVSSAKIVRSDGEFKIEFRLWDPTVEEQISSIKFKMKSENAWRRAAHKISDLIYSKLTGEKGYFDTRIVFVSESGNFKKRTKKLAIMDQDGANYKELTDGRYMVLTPRFDHKLQRAIYMSYKNTIPQVFILDINTGKQILLGNFPGMSFAPRFSPDGQNAIMSVARNGTTDIYEVSIKSKELKRLTEGFGTIDTSPSYSPVGEQVVFTSDRGGKPQLYVMNRDGSDVKRISFGDGSYSTPVWSPRGDFIAFTKQLSGTFYIGVMRPDGTGERLLSSSWMDEGPTWAPNGRVIMFSRQKMGEGYKLYAIDLTGFNERQIKTPTDASDPAWSPLLD